MYAFVAVAGLLVLLLAPAYGCAATPSPQRNETIAPEPPREYVDTTLVASTGRTIPVHDGDDLQDAIDVAQPGDTIVLDAGAIFKGPFTLPKKTGNGWVTMRTSTPDKQFPPPGTRVSPSHATLMPKLISWKGEGVVLADRSAHHYRFIGIEVAPYEGTSLYSLMWFGSNRERTLEEQPHHIIVDPVTSMAIQRKDHAGASPSMAGTLQSLIRICPISRKLGRILRRLSAGPAPARSRSATTIWKGPAKT
jgi:hypothetical protein